MRRRINRDAEGGQLVPFTTRVVATVEEFENFKLLCALRNKSCSEVFRELIVQYVGDKMEMLSSVRKTISE